jgi:hypothetical protein
VGIFQPQKGQHYCLYISHLKASIRVLEKKGFHLKGKGPEEGTIAYEFLKRSAGSVLGF